MPDSSLGQNVASRFEELKRILTTPRDELERAAGYSYCEDCGGEFGSFSGDTSRYCGNCSATRHLPRCGHQTVVHLGLGAVEGASCQRPQGHTGHHTYGRRRS